jgi:acyl-coenzyme A synthetase/AMP-(fatty) acid ligase
MCPNWESKLAQRANGEVEGFVGREDDVIEHAAHQAATESLNAAVANQNQTSAAVNVDDLVRQVVAAIQASGVTADTTAQPAEQEVPQASTETSTNDGFFFNSPAQETQAEFTD